MWARPFIQRINTMAVDLSKAPIKPAAIKRVASKAPVNNSIEIAIHARIGQLIDDHTAQVITNREFMHAISRLHFNTPQYVIGTLDMNTGLRYCHLL